MEYELSFLIKIKHLYYCLKNHLINNGNKQKTTRNRLKWQMLKKQSIFWVLEVIKREQNFFCLRK